MVNRKILITTIIIILLAGIVVLTRTTPAPGNGTTANPLLINLTNPSSVYTPKEVWNKRNALLNKRITVQGKAESFATICTEMGCPQEDPCCNGCFGPLGFHIETAEIQVCEKKTGECRNLEHERFLRIYGKEKQDYEYNDGFFGLYKGKRVQCTGDNCGNTFGCYPLEHEQTYQLTGVLKKDTPEYGWVTHTPTIENLYIIMENFELIQQ